MDQIKVYEVEFEDALSRTGYGRFHLKLLLLLGAGYSCIAMEMTAISFVIPSAKCDFQMSSSNAGLLNALPSLGIILGSLFWGALADVAGRKWVYSSSLFLTGLLSLLSSISQYFSLFVILRTLNGFCIAGALGLSLPYLSEFQPQKIREKVLCTMEIWWTFGIIAVPCLAWLIIPLTIRLENEYFIYSSWNIFLVCTSTPTMILGAWACSFPESPKYLVETGQLDKALNVLGYIFKENTGRRGGEFEVKSLGEKSVSIIDSNINDNRIKETNRSIKCTLKNFKVQVKILFEKEYLKRTLLICFISYCLLAAYYTLMMWFPELFSRFQRFETLYPKKSTSVCQVSSVFVEEKACDANVDSQVFLNTLIIGLACIPTSLWLPLSVKTLGPKFFIIFCVVLSASVTAAMHFVSNSLQNLILCCVFEAFTSLAVVTLYCALVDLFPTNVRTMATGLSLCFGRMGALTGNLVFGYLIDVNCSIPIAMISILLFVSAFSTFFLPIKAKTLPSKSIA
ncbi:hypothetical protein O3M35_011003 [Rhynocoris fuscipes]|uniref:Major facilitator superfamily (MFS) profile domain-containing protein n=1 Tax=Rhynocoris fuscipes TaxID=488301 RepID=A0AAW1D2I8_9HEMI